MANGINKVIALGNLTNDAELRVTPGGKAVLKFSVACNESFLDRNNERQERTEFIRCTLWGKRGESLAQYLTKGSQVYVEGSMHTSSYEKDGEKRYSTEVSVSEIVLLGGKKGDAPAKRENGGAKKSQPLPDDNADDSIPF